MVCSQQREARLLGIDSYGNGFLVWRGNNGSCAAGRYGMSAMQKAMEAEKAYRERIADKVLSEEGGG